MVQVKAAQIPQMPSLLADEQVNRHCDGTACDFLPLTSTAIPFSLGGRGAGRQTWCCPLSLTHLWEKGSGTEEQRGSVMLASEPVQGQGEALLSGEAGKDPFPVQFGLGMS